MPLNARVATTSDKNNWNNHVSHPLQSWEWGEFRRSQGIDVVRLIVSNEKKVTGCWQLTFHSIPYLPWTIGYFPKGPALTDEMIEILTKIGQDKHAIFIQLEPDVEHITPACTGRNDELQVTNYLRPSHHPLFTKYTFVSDLTKSEENLLQSMHSKTRYNIRVAQKHNVTVQIDNSKQAFETYLQLSKETTQRQGFYAHNDSYHRDMWKHMSQNSLANLWTATYQNKILASWILFSWKDILYYPYGASSREHRDVMAPNLLLWEIIRWGKKHGYKSLDLWGALGPNPDPKDPWYGFHRFKEGYAPQLITFVGSFDLRIHWLLYHGYCVADRLRWFLLHRTKNI